MLLFRLLSNFDLSEYKDEDNCVRSHFNKHSAKCLKVSLPKILVDSLCFLYIIKLTVANANQG